MCVFKTIVTEKLTVFSNVKRLSYRKSNRLLLGFSGGGAMENG